VCFSTFPLPPIISRLLFGCLLCRLRRSFSAFLILPPSFSSPSFLIRHPYPTFLFFSVINFNPCWFHLRHPWTLPSPLPDASSVRSSDFPPKFTSRPMSVPRFIPGCFCSPAFLCSKLDTVHLFFIPLRRLSVSFAWMKVPCPAPLGRAARTTYDTLSPLIEAIPVTRIFFLSFTIAIRANSSKHSRS